MGKILAVRHGQASFFGDDYDVLSALGKEQAVLLGRYCLSHGIRFDAAISGPRKRQIDTARAILGEFQSAGVPGPQLVALDEFDEYQVDRLLPFSGDSPILNVPALTALWEDYRGAIEPDAKIAAFERLFQATARAWQGRELSGGSIESWETFVAQVDRGIDLITSQQKSGARILLVTSAGTIGAILQRAMQASDSKALEAGWRVRNASVSSFLFSGNRFGLDQFNVTSHLEEARLLTYR
jgi:broad specificity phosphatase PhoE